MKAPGSRGFFYDGDAGDGNDGYILLYFFLDEKLRPCLCIQFKMYSNKSVNYIKNEYILYSFFTKNYLVN